MRNIPLQFIDERVLEDVQKVEARAKKAREDTMPAQNWLARFSQWLANNLDGNGPNSIAQFERAMRGTRSLAK